MSQLSVSLTSKEQVVEKAETKEPRRSSRPNKPNRCYTETKSIDSTDTNSYSSNLLSKLIWHIKPSGTLQHPDTFIVKVVTSGFC